ncbi:carbohydrate ABC transporter permease [Actinocrinis sp.]|uniref:carbohydrate ABC transporter permease n=1 Tax=Actinocrinis sp. TaxID=1920516 RepID=UPI002D189EF3|nr:carbohydrate ABC transporter permease [Actinocrinis sp.]HXR72411.1 carbohydrate ABC transporter permease [Actinocrinis sp.]
MTASTPPATAPRSRARKRRGGKTALGIALTAVMLFPVYWMLNASFTRDQDLRKTPPSFLPLHGTLEGYRAVIHQQLPYLGTSLVVGLATVALTLLLAAPAGYSLAKLRPRGAGALTFVLLVAQMIPGIIMAMGFYAILLTSHLINTLPGLVVADSTIAVPFGVLVFTAFMAGIPDELMQAAKTDGAGPLRTFTAIVLPLSRNAVVTVSLFTFLWAWSDFIFASTLDSGSGRQPITLGIYHYIGNNNQQWNAIMATAVVASIPATALLIIAQRYVAAGITTGAVKD